MYAQKLLLTIFTCIAINIIHFEALAACAGTDRTWTGSTNTSWGKGNNWSGSNVPNTNTENAIIVSAARTTKADMSATVSCLDVQSGILVSKNGNTLSIEGDYFRANTLNTVEVAASHTSFWFDMAGSTAQSFEVIDPITNLRVSNSTIVTLSNSFTIRNQLEITGTGTTVYINGDLNHSSTTVDFIIPALATVEVAAGKTLTIGSNLDISGTLVLKAGASLVLSSGKNLTVNSGGLIRLEGASGNVSSISSSSGSFNFNVAGTFYGDYFRIDRAGTAGAGLNLTGSISKIDNGEFHYIPSAGYGVTLGAGVSVPTTWDSVGFFDDDGHGNNGNIDASNYDVSDITFDNWGGLGSANENDPNNRLFWGDETPTALSISVNNNSGTPVSPVTAGAAASEFAIFAFSLNQDDVATDITEVTFTLTGTGDAGDVDYLQVFNQGASCQTVGAQIGSNFTMSGSPAKATITIPAATVTTSSTTPACIHVYLKTTSSAENSATLGLKVESTLDVINSQSYDFSETSGPPVSAPSATINGDPTRLWIGKAGTLWNSNSNWANGSSPYSGVNCNIQSGDNDLILNQNGECQNMTFVTGGSTDMGGGFSLTAFGGLEVQSGFTFTNATNASLIMGGSANQSLVITSEFPGNLSINNTTSTSVISVDSDSSITGNLTVTSGILRIADGATLTIGGNVVVQTGATLDIEGNGTLALGNGGTLTIDSGATLEMIGGANDATVTSTGGAAAITVTINGTIKAQKFIFDQLGTSGVTINSGATIDATYYLQDGTFKHPVNDNSTLLNLYKAIPGNTLSGMTFDMNGSSANSVTITNVYTDSSIGAGTLSINSFSGNLGGASFDDDNTYLLAWSGEQNTIDVSQEATGPTTVNQGQSYTMGHYGFKQDLAGASYIDTNITGITFTLTGTASSNYIEAARIYLDSNCDGTGESQLGTDQTFSGVPATTTFSSLTGLTVEASTTAPPLVCVLVEFDISGTAVNASTVGVKINQDSHIVDDQSYGVSSGTPLPINLGSPATIVGSSTTWIGTTSSDWTNAANWNGGVPTASLNCTINSSSNDPVISSGTATCNSITQNSGALTINSGATLEVYGDFNSSSTVTQNGTIQFRDDGVTSGNHTITTSSPLGNLSVSKTAGGVITLSSSTVTVDSLSLSGSNYNFAINSGKTLTANTGVTVSGGQLTVFGAGTLEIGNGQTLLVNGGTLTIDGLAEASPQNLSNKAIVTVAGTGSWGFSATSGTVFLDGFRLDYLDTNGLVIGGSAILSQFNGGQFTNLSESYSSVKVIQINTTGSIPATATNVGFNWGPSNTYPANTESYTILYSSGCNSGSMDFDYWFGDWYENTPTFDVSTKVDVSSCNLSFGGSTSPVSLASYDAVPYDGKVDVRWVTNLETDHYGFNLFRADGEGNYIQVNEELIRNFNTSSTLKGSYRFIDSGVTNGKRYYYYLQDIAYNGDIVTHGPVGATPTSGLGLPPADEVDENTGENPGGGGANPDPSTIPNSSYEDLGDGVIILSKSNQTLRLKIVPGAITYSASAWDGSYQTLDIVGYAKKTTANFPELLEKIILIEVDESFSTASLLEQKALTTSVEAGHLIAPAPSFAANGSGVLIPSYAIDAEAYATNSFGSETYYEIAPNLLAVGNKKYLKVIIHPTYHNPVTSEIKRLDELIIDIGLDSNSWAPSAPNSFESPYTLANTLSFSYTSAGMYELSFNQLVNSFVEAPFADVDVDDLRLYQLEEEIPIEVVDTNSDGLFNSGDSLRFYLTYVKSLEAIDNVAILSTIDILGEGAPLRIPSLDGDPALATYSNSELVPYRVASEKNYLAILDSPIGTYNDPFYWKKIFAPYPAATAYEYLDMPVQMNFLEPGSGLNVKVKVYLKGSHGINSDLTHNLGLYVNGDSILAASQTISHNNETSVEFNVPAYLFHEGSNTIRVRALGDQIPNGEYDVMYIDKAVLTYYGRKEITSGYGEVINLSRGEEIVIAGATSTDISLYDVSAYNTVSKMTNFTTSINVEGHYDTSFFSNTGDSGFLGKKYILLENDSFLTASKLRLTPGFETDLKDTSLNYDYIVIGTRPLLAAAGDLIAHREGKGHDVLAVTPDQIFAEFSFGLRTSRAIKTFLNYAYNYWSTKPKYILLLGDSTYDPKDHFEYEIDHSKSLPIKYVRGHVFNYGSDNWFVTPDDGSSNIPLMAIGRIPSNDETVIADYVDKVINYENGESSPSMDSKNVVFYSNISENNEDFIGKSQSLANSPKLSSANFTPAIVDRETMTDAEFKANVNNGFNGDNFLINYLGHGAEDLWASESGYSHLENSDVESMTNRKLPIVMALNCLNNHFFDPDDTLVTLSESLILKKDAGAIAFIGSATMTTPMGQTHFARNLIHKMGEISASSSQGHRLGDLMVLAKAQLRDDEYHYDILSSFSLMGDPALEFPQGFYESVQSSPSFGGGTEDSEESSDSGPLGCSADASKSSNGHPLDGLLEVFALVVFYRLIRHSLFMLE